ncbi:MAG: helix-turn-helix domain-containing protein [Phycisphaerales bacterium]
MNADTAPPTDPHATKEHDPRAPANEPEPRRSDRGKRRSSRASTRAERAVDLRIGQRLRTARRARGLSQSALAAELSITFQQLQKYESAANRISASRLVSIGIALEVPVGYFLDPVPKAVPPVAGPGEAIPIAALAAAMPLEWRFAYRLLGELLYSVSPLRPGPQEEHPGHTLL